LSKLQIAKIDAFLRETGYFCCVAAFIAYQTVIDTGINIYYTVL